METYIYYCDNGKLITEEGTLVNSYVHRDWLSDNFQLLKVTNDDTQVDWNVLFRVLVKIDEKSLLEGNLYSTLDETIIIKTGKEVIDELTKGQIILASPGVDIIVIPEPSVDLEKLKQLSEIGLDIKDVINLLEKRLLK